MHGPCVLIADDDLDVRDALVEVVRDAGYEVEEAANGAAALDAMRRRRPCLIVLDLMMPVIDGWQVAEEMQRDPSLSDIPICVVSAVADRTPPTVACVLRKPPDLDRLLAEVESRCGSHADVP